MAVVYNWAVDILENGGYITYYGDGGDTDAASVNDYSTLYVHSEAGGRANSNDVTIPAMMSWLKEIDNFFVNSINDLTVTDPIKQYSVNEHATQLFGTCTFGEGGQRTYRRQP